MKIPRLIPFGFSLVEVVLALGLMAFTVVAILGLLNVGLGASRSAQIDTVEAGAVRSLMAALRTNSPGTFSGTTVLLNYDGSLSTNGAAAAFQCTVTTNAPPARISATNMVALQLVFQYPLAASATNRTTKTFHASLLRQ